MDELRFSSIEELYQRVLPALTSKRRELAYYHYSYITEEDIWDYLKENKWVNRNNLTLYDIIDDIFHTDNEIIDEYVHKKHLNIKESN